MRLLSGHDETVWRWANRFFEGELARPDWAVGVIDRDGVLRGALIGDERTPWTAEVTICGEKAFTPFVAKAFFAAYFARYWRLEVRTTRDNKTIKRNAPKWGLKFEGTARDYFGQGRSALMFSMLKSECRWINLKVGTDGIEAKSSRAA
jgi:hypothetical protein